MKNDSHDDDMDTTEDRSHGGKSETYNDEMARKATKSLFDDDENEANGKENSFVTGYDRPSRPHELVTPHDSSAGGESGVRIRERPSRIDPSAQRIESSSSRSRSRLFEDDLVDDEPVDEIEEPVAPRRRPRTGFADDDNEDDNPSPKPAVKVNPASGPANRRSNTRARPLPSSRDDNDPDDDGYNTFRTRGRNRDESRSSDNKNNDYRNTESRGYEPKSSDHRNPDSRNIETRQEGRQAGPLHRQPQRSSGNVPVRPLGDRGGSYEDADFMNIIRYVVAGVILVIFIILVVLIVSNVGLRRQLNEATETIANAPSASEDSSEMQITIDKLNEEIKNAKNEIEDLKGELLEAKAGTITQPSDYDEPALPNTSRPTDSTPQTPEPTPTQQSGGRSHTVVSGDSLGKIARQYYGTNSQANIDKIVNANKSVITDPNNIRVGQTFLIPD